MGMYFFINIIIEVQPLPVMPACPAWCTTLHFYILIFPLQPQHPPVQAQAPQPLLLCPPHVCCPKSGDGVNAMWVAAWHCFSLECQTFHMHNPCIGFPMPLMDVHSPQKLLMVASALSFLFTSLPPFYWRRHCHTHCLCLAHTIHDSDRSSSVPCLKGIKCTLAFLFRCSLVFLNVYIQLVPGEQELLFQIDRKYNG